jgi:hypothetical protein
MGKFQRAVIAVNIYDRSLFVFPGASLLHNPLQDLAK